MICIPITAGNTEDALEDIRQANELADIIELRLDLIRNPDIKKLKEACKKPVIATARGNPELLQRAVDLGVEYADIELENAGRIDRKNSRLIISYHNFEETPENLGEIYSNIKKHSPDIIKIAGTAKSIKDNLGIFDLIKTSNTSIIALCMGEYGELSRILCLKFGAFLTYGSLESGKESAPGQIPAKMLRDTYRINSLSEKTKVLGVIGNPVKHSRGKYSHNFIFRSFGIDAVYVSFLTDNIAETMEVLHYLDVKGCSVTMPCKQDIMQYLDEIDPKAAKIGAVNTIVNSNGIFRGYNTDYIGAKKALEKNAEVKGRNVVILGAGGASRAVALAVMELGGSLTILNRTQEKAGQIADEMGCSFGSLHELNDLKPDILINCTSVGMLDENSPVEKSLLKNMTVMEVVYSKEKTRLIKDAEANGCKTINGMEMYLYQGIAQEKLWNNIDVSVELMRQASNANNAD